MGKLVSGQWVKSSIVTSDKKGAYDRLPRTFRDTISKEHNIFQPESGRYHLYVGYACPWASRTLIFRELKGLNDHISISVVHPDMLEEGWIFNNDINNFPGSTVDHLHSFQYLREVYTQADENITTSVTVPILWDKKTNTIVNNESSEIIRIFNSSFNQLTGNQLDYYPKHLHKEINQLNEEIYSNVNNGVYKSGFAKTQSAYNIAVSNLFETLDKLDSLLENKQYLLGDILTEADLRLIPTLVRFDLVYYTHFKCNIRQIKSYKNLSRYTKELYEIPAIKNATHFDHIKRHYYYSHESINPYRIIPKGPDEIF